MPSPTAPDALMFLSSTCPRCASALTAMAELLKRGVIGRLEAVNLDHHAEAAGALGVCAVPWARLGPFVLTGARGVGELEIWARRARGDEGMADALHDLLRTGDLAQVRALLADDTGRLRALLPIVANPDASINVRLGAGAAFEEYAGSDALRALVSALGELARHADARVRADACHYLGLSGDAAAGVWLRAALDDDDASVREIAADSLAALEGAA